MTKIAEQAECHTFHQQVGIPEFADIWEARLEECYTHHIKSIPNNTYSFEEFVLGVIDKVDDAVESPIDILAQFYSGPDGPAPEEKIRKLPIGAIIVAAVYLHRACQFWHNRIDAATAWAYMADGAYWTGVAFTGGGVSAFQKSERQKKAVSGALKRNAQNIMLKNYALQLVHDRRPPINGWQSRRSAALKIHEEVKEFAIANDIKPVKDTTVVAWMEAMNDTAGLFPLYHKSKAKTLL